MGATPEIVFPSAFAPKSPAAMPATWVAWNELSGSKGTLAYFQAGDGGAKVRCTITFGVVYFV